MKRIRYTLIVGIAIIAMIQVIMLNRDSTHGEKLVSIQKEIEMLEGYNDMLTQNIASASSLQTIETYSRYIGLTKEASIVSLASPLPLAQR